MCIIIKEMPLYWIIGLLALWSGVIAAGDVTAAPGVATTTSNEISAFIISIKITNRIYNDSLEDHQSQSYKILRQDVENVFFEMYSFTPSAQYQEVAEMTFSNGSVIANSTVLFGTKQKSAQTVKNIFVSNYQQHPSMKLDINISYTADQEPIHAPLSLLQDIPVSISISSVTASINSDTATKLSDHIPGISTTSTTLASTISGPDKSLDNNNASTATPQTHSTTSSRDFTHSASQTTSNSTSNNSNTTVHPSITSTMAASSPSTMMVHPSSKFSTMSVSSPLNTTVHSNSNISTISGSSPLTMTVHPSSNISTMSASNSSTTAVHPSSNISTISASSFSTTAIHPSNISTMSASNSSTTAIHPSNISTMSASNSTTAVHPSSNISTISASSFSTTAIHPSNISTMSASNSSTTAVHPSSNISAMSASSSSVSPGKTVTKKPTGPAGSDTVATDQVVPGWGIAILVLAAIILFFMLVLLILLLLFWCCWWRQRGFMSVSDPDPTGYYNPDIPMYSTHSTYDSHNGKSLDSDSERIPKNQIGMYAVNK